MKLGLGACALAVACGASRPAVEACKTARDLDAHAAAVDACTDDPAVGACLDACEAAGAPVAGACGANCVERCPAWPAIEARLRDSYAACEARP